MGYIAMIKLFYGLPSLKKKGKMKHSFEIPAGLIHASVSQILRHFLLFDAQEYLCYLLYWQT